MITRFCCIITALCFTTNAVAWDAFDMQSGYSVEIEAGDPFSKGNEIHFRRFDADDIRKATVIDTDWSEASVEVEIRDLESGDLRVLEFIID